MTTSYPGATPSTCARGHDWATNRSRNSSNGGWTCGICKKYRWHGNARLVCRMDGCPNFMKSRVSGLCCTHERRRRVHGDPTALTRAPNGAGHVNVDGYREVYVNGAKVQAHRHVMEMALGRDLLAHETVHHKNGVRSDNRLDNLELWSSAQPSGQRVEDKVAWMVAFLAQYGYVVSRE